MTAPTAPTVRIACFAFCATSRQDGKIDAVQSECSLAAGLCFAACGFSMKNRSAKDVIERYCRIVFSLLAEMWL
jgi:hypothetical protein